LLNINIHEYTINNNENSKLNKLNFAQKTLVTASIVTFASFLLMSFIIVLEDENQTFISVAATDMNVALYNDLENPQETILPSTERFTVQNQKAKTNIGEFLVTYGTEYSYQVGNADTTYFDSGVAFIKTNFDGERKMYLNDKVFFVLPESEFIIDTENEEIYVVNGNIVNTNNQIVVANQKLSWSADTFDLEMYDVNELENNQKILDIIYFMYDINELPEALEEISPANNVLP